MPAPAAVRPRAPGSRLPVGILAGVLLLVAGCGSAAGSTPAKPPQTAAATGGASAPSGAASGTGSRPSVSGLRVAWSAPVPDMTPLWIAQQNHYFQKYGLGVTLVHINPGVQVASVVSGKTPIAIGGGAAPMEAVTQGSKLVILGTFTDRLLTTLIANKTITSISQLKGKTIGTTAPYSVLDVALRIALKKAGIVYGKQVKITYSENIPTLVAGLEAGTVQAVMLSPPYNVQLSHLGYHVLINMGQENIPVAQLVAYGNATWIKAHPNATLAFLKGMVDGLRGTETYSTYWKALHAYLPNVSPAAAKAVYGSYLPMWKTLVNKPNTTVTGLRAWQQQLVSQDPKLASVNLKSLIDNGPLDRLESSGFMH